MIEIDFDEAEQSPLLVSANFVGAKEEEAEEAEEEEIIGAKNRRFFAPWILPAMFLGMGMFLESYSIFSIGQIKSIWGAAYPECWTSSSSSHQVIPRCPNRIQCYGFYNSSLVPQNNGSSYCLGPHQTYPKSVLCSPALVKSISYIEFAGIMLGMLVLAALIDLIGRRAGGITTVSIMLLGSLGMSLAPQHWGLETMFITFGTFYGIYGFGVGGEYPTCASSSAEQTPPQAKRGQRIAISFSMQGLGAVVGSAVICLLLVAFQQTGPQCYDPHVETSGYSATDLTLVWKITLGLGTLALIAVVTARWFLSKNTSSFEYSRIQLKQISGHASWLKSYLFDFHYYGPRLFADAFCWFLWDIAFYGNKLFSAPIFAALIPNGDLLHVNLFILANNIVALIGYYAAAFLIDHPLVGRRRLQVLGFSLISLLFGACAIWFRVLPSGVLVALYMVSSFFGQFVNVGTFVCPAEMFPAARRATCHGLCAFSGKAGALLATVLFGYLTTREIFAICAVVSVIALVPSLIFLPNLAGLELREIEKQFRRFLQQRVYNGEAVNPKFCSRWERWRGYCTHYHASDQHIQRDHLTR